MSTCADCGYETDIVCKPGSCGFAQGRRQWKSLWDRIRELKDMYCREHERGVESRRKARLEKCELQAHVQFSIECLDSWAKTAEEFPVWSQGKAEVATYTALANRLRRCL